jgi:hypothetical protein
VEAVSLSRQLLAAARAGDDAEISRAVEELAAVRPPEIEGDPARVAFWLNVYNGRLLHAFHDHPRSGHLFRHRGLFRSTGYVLDGREHSLDQIEHGLLRRNRRAPFALRRTLPVGDPRLAAAPAVADPRIHFALNCGAVSCPPIAEYDEAGVGSALDAATRSYLEAETVLDGDRVVLPGLMKLYRGDFDAAGGPVEFALAHLPDETAEAIRELPRLKVGWSRFDWTLVAPQGSSDLSAK